jgi:hypothetical protein
VYPGARGVQPAGAAYGGNGMLWFRCATTGEYELLGCFAVTSLMMPRDGGCGRCRGDGDRGRSAIEHPASARAAAGLIPQGCSTLRAETNLTADGNPVHLCRWALSTGACGLTLRFGRRCALGLTNGYPDIPSGAATDTNHPGNPVPGMIASNGERRAASRRPAHGLFHGRRAHQLYASA